MPNESSMREGLELAARFSLPPNQLGLCGPKKADCSSLNRLLSTMKKFRAPYAYMRLIAEANGLEPFDYEVTEAFWLGNKRLHGIQDEDMEGLIRTNFVGKDLLAPTRAEALIDQLPRRIYPHHAFHVFYVGSVTGVLKRTSGALDSCRVAWGEVKELEKNRAVVSYSPIEMSRKSVRFAKAKTARWHMDAQAATQSIEEGDTLASHWKTVAMTISGRQQKNLQKYTQINMALFAQRPQES